MSTKLKPGQRKERGRRSLHEVLAGVELIKAERLRQISKEKWSAEHDDAHNGGQLAQAAASYALHAAGISTSFPKGMLNGCCLWWPWARRWWKPKTPIKDLMRAGALIAAEIDRLERLKGKPANTKL